MPEQGKSAQAYLGENALAGNQFGAEANQNACHR